MKIWPILILTIGLSIVVGYSLVSMERVAVMNNWDAVRCNPFVMFASPFLKPDSDSQSVSQFSSANFSFCSKKLVQGVLKLALAPFTAIFGEHLSIGTLISQILDAIYYILAKLYEAFLSFLEPFSNDLWPSHIRRASPQNIFKPHFNDLIQSWSPSYL